MHSRESLLDKQNLSELLEKRGYELDEVLRAVERWGLAATGLTEDTAGIEPHLRNAGQQVIAAEGEIDGQALRFLPIYVDDLLAREALLVGGSIMVDEFAAALATHGAPEHARGVVPATFREAVTNASR